MVGAINVVAVPGVVVVVVVVGIRRRCGVCTSKSNCKKTVSEAKKMQITSLLCLEPSLLLSDAVVLVVVSGDCCCGQCGRHCLVVGGGRTRLG